MGLVEGDKRKDCCRDDANLGPEERVDGTLTFRRCQVCGCRHFVKTVEKGTLGVAGAKVG